MADIEMSDQYHPVDDEDTIMHDASMLPADESELGVMDSSYDPMDISPLSMRNPSPVGAQPKGTVLGHLPNPSAVASGLDQNYAVPAFPNYGAQPKGTVLGHLPNPSAIASGLGQNDAAPAVPKYNGRGFSHNITRSPVIRVTRRFSPKSPIHNPYLTTINPAKSVLRPLHLQNQTPVKDPLERMKRMFRPPDKGLVMVNSSEQISEKKIDQVPEIKISEPSSEDKSAAQSSNDKTTLHLNVKETPSDFQFPFRVHEPEASRKRCYNDGPAHPCNYQVPEVAGHINTKYRRVSINDFPVSAMKANDKQKPAESLHTPPTHDRAASDRVTDEHMSAQNGHRVPSITTPHHIPGAWPESSPVYDPLYATVEDVMMTGAITTVQDDIVMTDENENPKTKINNMAIDSMEIDERNQATQNMDIDQNEAPLGEQNANFWRGYWHGYWQAAYQGTTKAVGTLLNFVRDTFSSSPSFGPVVDQTFSIFRRRHRTSPERRRGSRESSPTHQHSPTRASLRSLPEEQRHKIRCHKWRSDRRSAGPVELPFPELHIEYPQSPASIDSSSPNKDQKMPGAISSKRAKNPKFTHRQKEKRSHRHRHGRSSSKHDSRNAKGNRSSMYGVHKQPATASTHPSQAWVQPMSPNVHRRVFFAHTPPRRYPELAEKERQYAAWRNGLGEKRRKEKELEAQIQEAARAAAAVRKEATGRAGDQRTSKEKEVLQENQKTQKNQQKQEKQEKKKSRKVHFPESPNLATEIAPHLRPAASETKLDEEQKENIVPTTEESEKGPEVTVENVAEAAVIDEAPPDTASESETDEDPWLRLDTPFGRPVSAVRLFYPDPQPLPAGRTESIYASEWREMEEEEKRKQRQTRIRPDGPAVRPLSEAWERKVSELRRLPPSRKVATTLNGDPLSQKDLVTCYTPMAWLNDEVINSYLAIIIEYLRRTHNNAGRHDKPRFHAFNSFFFANLRDKGYESVRRWASRAKIGGESLLDVDTVFVPVHHNSHWTLIVVKPMAKTIEHFDSLGPPSRSHIAVIKSWLREELGPKFRGDEWTALPSQSPQQNNGSDCGAFLLSTAKSVAIGLEPMSYGATDVPLLRRRIVAELMAGRLEGEFDPAHGGEVLL
ncbi:SUMO protease ULP1 [Aspergillus affinis]|uniref:SUMO protease ULP1 n=1 Tax=Aspergillus affinis TaxID=1070780 RepID=UPI0022FED694|nr:uncharacterized protein KD926_000738 [Aspergillus affinis]KAI9037232.1 hypothetical protein KD926_000738 [Aspergillus affinis]